MKRLLLSVFLLLALVILGVGAQSSGQSVDADFESLRDPALLQSLLMDPPPDFYLVDVRTAEEYRGGHIPTAIQIDYRDIGANPPTDTMDATIVVYCRSGNRSGSAAATLEALGYTRVLDWGGIARWPVDLVVSSSPE